MKISFKNRLVESWTPATLIIDFESRKELVALKDILKFYSSSNGIDVSSNMKKNNSELDGAQISIRRSQMYNFWSPLMDTLNKHGR